MFVCTSERLMSQTVCEQCVRFKLDECLMCVVLIFFTFAYFSFKNLC